jgi:O-antigen/teichoic acid export membrane protein
MTGWILQLLGVRASMQLFIGINSSMLFAVGTSRYQAWGNTAKFVVLTVGLWIAFDHFGFRAATWVLALSPLAVYVSLMIGFYRNFRKLVVVEVASFVAFVSCVALSAGVVFLAR